MRLGEGLDAVLEPRSIAIVGASQDPTKIGGRPVQLLRKHGYAGPIFPVNPRAAEVQGLPAFASVADLPQAADLAVIAVPAEAAPQAVQDCANRGVRAAVVLSSGFSELGQKGADLQRRLGDIAARTGIRLVGPNCLGTVGVADRAIATFSIVLESEMPSPGPLAIVSQSGNLGSFTMRLAMERGIGVSRFMTTGNECDLDIADGLAWLAGDPATRVILCCMETCRDSAKLVAALDAARKAGKPVVVLKIGSSDVGQAAAASHTGALAGSDAVFDAVFERHGAIRVRSIEQLMNVGHAATVLLPGGLPKGKRVALITASGGFGVMMADAASAAGLAVPRLSEAAQQSVLSVVPYASARNPVDTTAQVSSRPEIMEEVLRAVLADETCDAAMLLLSSSLHLPRLRTVYMEALRRLRAALPDRLLMLVVKGPADAVEELNAMGYPTVDGIDAACATLASLAAMGQASTAPLPSEPDPIDLPQLRPEALAHEHGAKAALAEAGLPVLREHMVADVDAAVAAANDVGYPVVIKIVSPDLPHKTEVGGVVVGIAGEPEMHEAYASMMASVRARAPGARLEGVLVAPMVSGGVELILGTKNDPIFGPVVVAGMGGIYAEIMQDVALRTAPVDRATALEMLRSLRVYKMLDGARGRPKADIAAAADAIVALSRFAGHHRDVIGEIDVNPLVVLPEAQGAVALDALIVGVTSHGKETT
ncbi:6-carboxyhexanoate--CoA ligase [Mesorhizobium sp. L-8-10]|uniref:acetate--CoA ligase family protein n=1 Tax=Mesorhizobium sp. L-8-10 TaxID=2744523 RepID=UPI001927B427|nr:acetate--CoA ligase family protein [Mesorhizobium sp. L-8-10]BCH28934.1 6-carboxyhexanoate--CoA ligase [Mesorhizobium sp. L-8-10]